MPIFIWSPESRDDDPLNATLHKIIGRLLDCYSGKDAPELIDIFPAEPAPSE